MAEEEKVAELQRRLDEANAVLAGTGIMPYRLRLYRTHELQTLKTNARYMRNDTFAQLVSNIQRDGGLGSTPLVYAGPDVEQPQVLSGNHRVMANKAAGFEFTLCLEIVDQKSEQERTAITLSHNAISGQDDLQTLKSMYDSILDLKLKAYSGIDEDMRQQLAKIEFSPITEPRLQFKTITFLFLPREIDELKACIDEVEKLLAHEHTFALMKRDYAEFFNAVATAKEKLNIRNTTVALLELIRRGRDSVEQQFAPHAEEGTTQ